MRIKQLSMLSLSVCLLCACSTAPTPPPRLDSTDHSLAEASYAVSRSISSLAETAQAAHPEVPCNNTPPNPASYGMGQLTSIDWSGPVEPIVQQIARVADYRVRVLGRPPAIPILVSVYDKNMMLGDILRDVGYQCGRRASITLFPASHVIELRYAKN